MNVSNYDAHVRGAAPVVEQLGPIVLRRYEQRYNTTRLGFFKEQVTFQARTFYQYVPSKSSPTVTLDSPIITPNPSWSLMKKQVGGPSLSYLCCRDAGPTSGCHRALGPRALHDDTVLRRGL
jgi:hypothetical protein